MHDPCNERAAPRHVGANQPHGDPHGARESRHSSAAFRVLYDRHAERIHGFLLRRTRDPGAAVELTAETFAQAWLSRDRYTDHDEGTIAPWLFGIARHVLAASVRRRPPGSAFTAA